MLNRAFIDSFLDATLLAEDIEVALHHCLQIGEHARHLFRRGSLVFCWLDPCYPVVLREVEVVELLTDGAEDERLRVVERVVEGREGLKS